MFLIDFDIILEKLKRTLKEFIKPSLISLCIAGSIRMAGTEKN